MKTKLTYLVPAIVACGAVLLLGVQANRPVSQPVVLGFDKQVEQNRTEMFNEGKQIFRFDTFGDEAFWGGSLRLHQAISGEKNGGVGPGVSPKTALSVGLKVDADALPPALVE